MAIEIETASRWRQATFRNLWQFYLYEFGRFMGWLVPEDGRFAEDDLDGCWTDARRKPFFIRVNGQLAGLTIVDERAVSPLTGTKDVRELTEMFVLPVFRKQGVGGKIATLLFDRFPGRWELRVAQQNVDAQPFWRKVVKRYTNGRFEERAVDLGSWKGTVHAFDNSGWARGAR